MNRAISILVLGILITLVAGSLVMADENPSFDFNLYGFIKLDGAYDQNLTSHGNFVMWVDPYQYDGDDEQFNMTANATRFGVSVDGNGYETAQVNGRIEFDLFAGQSAGIIEENRPMLQLRHAYFSVQMGNTMLLAGQSYDLISPLNPSTLNYSELWGCGNIGYRRPQISLWQTLSKSESTDIRLAGGFFRTIGDDLTPTFSLAAGETRDGEDDGTDAGIPSFQTLLDINHHSDGGSTTRFGVSMLYGTLKSETNLGGSENYESWGINGHFMMQFASGFGISGEVYTGSNLQSYLGGILENSTIDGVSSTGAWGSAWMQASQKVELSGGFGLDNVNSDDIGFGRSKNFSIYGNIRYLIVANATLGLEVSHWATEYKIADNTYDTYNNLRLQTSMILNF
jgi:hypothetical protein